MREGLKLYTDRTGSFHRRSFPYCLAKNLPSGELLMTFKYIVDFIPELG
jgi:hypothetical protein